MKFTKSFGHVRVNGHISADLINNKYVALVDLADENHRVFQTHQIVGDSAKELVYELGSIDEQMQELNIEINRVYRQVARHLKEMDYEVN